MTTRSRRATQAPRAKQRRQARAVGVPPLPAQQLRQRCNPAQFDFETTAELEDLNDVLGQERAVEAIRFGIGIQREGYNLFALGPSGTGKRTTIFYHSEPLPSRSRPTCATSTTSSSRTSRACCRCPPGRGACCARTWSS